MAYSLRFVLQTQDFMDAAGLLKIWSWAQDSWKQICFNKLWITELNILIYRYSGV